MLLSKPVCGLHPLGVFGGQTDVQPIVDCKIGAQDRAAVAPVGVAGLGSGSLAPPLPAAWFSQ